jgi:Pregnancy-associated plasma protein-A
VGENRKVCLKYKTIFSPLTKKNLHLFIVFVLLFSTSSIFAQQKKERCGTRIEPQMMGILKSRVLPGHGDCTTINKIDKTFQISLWIAVNSQGATNISTADIDGALVRLNNDFLPSGMKFQYCKIENMENDRWDSLTVFPTYNEELQMRALHYEPNTINIYLVDTIGKPEITPGGYAYFPGGPDVIVCLKSSYNEDSPVLSHEMGHFFGLYHTFETDFGNELVDASNCETTGDFVCDTRADPDPEGNADDEDQCNYTGPTTQDANGDWYLPPTDNIMSYYPDECVCRFTPQQFNRMIDQYLNFRNYLW